MITIGKIITPNSNPKMEKKTSNALLIYKDQDGYRIRTKGGVSRERILNDPAYARTRENLTEFGHSATSGKLLRQSIIAISADAKDKRVTSRVTQVMSLVKNEDLTSPRGQRKVEIGISTTAGKAWLKGFEFNNRATLSSVLLTSYNLDTATGEVTLVDFIPMSRVNAPQGATHVSFNCGFLNLDFATSVHQMEVSNTVNLAINNTATNITLTPAAVPTGTGTAMYFLKLSFFQELNGEQYPLNNGAFNALQLIEVL
jgi:hypothetical protein